MEELQVWAAYDQAPMEKLKMVDKAQAESAMEQAATLFRDRAHWIPTPQRIAILERAAQMVVEQREDLALTAAREGGKPLRDSLVEIDRGVEGIKVAVRELCQLHGTEIPMGFTSSSLGRMAYTRREPRGVVLAISAFNHPFNLIVHQVVPAVAAGCPVLVKPALTTPLSCRNLLDILYRAGLPQQWCQMMICDTPVAASLATDRRMSFLTFIGSAAVGWHLRSQLPPGAHCVLEHGGAAPAIIDKSCDLQKAVPLLVKGGYYHAGQVCVSVQRIIAHQDIVRELARQMTVAVKALVVGDPALEQTEVGPLILPQEVDRVHSWVERAVVGGAQLLCGGEKISATCYAPTLLLNPPLDSEVSTREIFGPVACLYSYQSLDEAIALANSVEYDFQASVFSRDLPVALEAIDKLQARAVMVNDHTAFRVDWMPFGGHRQSGLGTGGIGHTLRDMTVEKMFVIKRD